MDDSPFKDDFESLESFEIFKDGRNERCLSFLTVDFLKKKSIKWHQKCNNRSSLWVKKTKTNQSQCFPNNWSDNFSFTFWNKPKTGLPCLNKLKIKLLN